MAKEYFEAGVERRYKLNIGDLVTDADIAVANFLVAAIHAKYPDHQIHTEEHKVDVNPGAQYEWVIDPIDGTRNFAIGLPMWCILICIQKDGQSHMAAVYNALANELFFAEKGQGAYLNGKKIQVNSVDDLDQAFGIVTRRLTHTTHVERYKRAIAKMATDHEIWMHNFGTMFGISYVASGGADFFLGNSGFDHDNLAPALICAEAGALVTDSDGNPWTRYRQDMVIANPKLHPKVMELFG